METVHGPPAPGRPGIVHGLPGGTGSEQPSNPEQPELQPPPSFQSLEDASTVQECEVAAAPLADHGPPALGCPGIVVGSGMQLQPALEVSDGVQPSLETVLKSIQDLKQEAKAERAELKGELRKMHLEQRHYVERVDTLEHTLTNLQVQHADAAFGIRALRERVEQLEYECAANYGHYTSGDRHLSGNVPNVSLASGDTPRQNQEEDDGCALWMRTPWMSGEPSPLELEHSTSMPKPNPPVTSMPPSWAQMRPSLPDEQRHLQSAAPEVGTVTRQAADQYRVPTVTMDLRSGVDAQVVAFHVPQEMQRQVLQLHGMNEKTETGLLNPTPSQDQAWPSPSRGDPGMRVSAQGVNLSVGTAPQAAGSIMSSGLPAMQYVPPARSDGATFSFQGEPTSPQEALQSYQDAQGRFISRPPAFPGVVSPTLQMLGDGAHGVGSPPGLELEEELSMSELNLLVKFLNSMGDLPRIDIGDAHDRGERLTLWRVAMETQLKTTRRVVVDWWRWCNGQADKCYQLWLRTPILERNQIKKVASPLPRRWEPIEDWFLPKILAVVPAKLKDNVMQEKVYGVDARVVDVIYHLLKLMQPGSMDEQDQLQKSLTSPNPCREPAAALKELRRWFAAMTRAVEIGMVLPGLDHLYRGARSIYVEHSKEMTSA